MAGTHPTGMHSCYHLQTKLRKGNVFTPVCQSFCSQGGVSASVHAGIHTPIPGQTSPWADTPQADTLPGKTPPGRHPLPVHAGIDMATAADGTHPTGMHSCFSVVIALDTRPPKKLVMK